MKLFSILALLIFLTSCGTGPHVPGGGIFTSIKGPIAVTKNTAKSKTGKACAMNVLGVVATGDNSIQMAKKKAGISKVSTVDYTRFSVLFFFTKVCTVVKGS